MTDSPETAGDRCDGRIEEDLDTFVVEECRDACAYVGIFAMKECGVAFQDGDPATEAAHRLCELEADVAAAENEDVFGERVEFERFDMCEWTGCGEARDLSIDARVPVPMTMRLPVTWRVLPSGISTSRSLGR